MSITSLDVLIFILGQTIVIFGASFYFYATPQKIVIGHGLFHTPAYYHWQDVTKIEETCYEDSHHTNAVSIWYDIDLKTGDSFSITTPADMANFVAFAKSKQNTSDGLAHPSYTYENDFPSKCAVTPSLSFLQ